MLKQLLFITTLFCTARLTAAAKLPTHAELIAHLSNPVWHANTPGFVRALAAITTAVLDRLKVADIPSFKGGGCGEIFVHAQEKLINDKLTTGTPLFELAAEIEKLQALLRRAESVSDSAPARKRAGFRYV